jgi:uncharacterized protein (DUF1800 family)
MSLIKYTAIFGESELTHLLKRTMFGAHLGDLNDLKGKSLDQVLQILLQDLPLPLSPINTYNDTNYTDPNVPVNQTWVNAVYGDGTVNAKRLNSFKGWWTGLLINQRLNIKEKMVFFWHNHFAVELDIVSDARFMYKYVALLQKYALGNFKTFVKEMTLNPAMLKYLNGYLNTKTAPDENYGRELQELFTMGKGVDSKYSENDVKAAAKVLTGYKIDSLKIDSYFDDTKHDTGNKQFSAFYNNTLITGKVGVNGSLELDELLNMIFKQNELALYICRKLYRFFVYYEITSDVEQQVIIPLADIFRNSNFEIKPVLLALLGCDHFYKTANRGCYIKTPLDHVVGICREFNLNFPDSTDTVTQNLMWQYIRTQAGNLQLMLGSPPNVAGWPAFYQVPQYYEFWINSDTLPKRNQFSDLMAGNGYTRNSKTIKIDPISYASSFNNPEDPNLLINQILAHLYVLDVSDNLKKQLKSIILSNQVADYYWTDAWVAYKQNPTDKTNKSIVSSRLLSMLKYVMNLAEFQLI